MKKRILSICIALAMVLSLIPVAVIPAAECTHHTAHSEECIIVPEGIETTTPAEFDVQYCNYVCDICNSDEDTVIYNLGSEEITVGENKDLAEEMPWCYKLFEEDGSYTIQLEDDAFFPYEVQFTYNGKTVEKWFKTPDSTVEIGNHEFSVKSNSVDETAVTQIGITVDGKYIPAYPKKKVFTNSPISTFSLIPLTEKEVTLDLQGYNRFDLQAVKVETVLSGISLGDTDKTAIWFSDDLEEYQVLNSDDTLNFLSSDFKYGFTLIVGTPNQIDKNNIKYLVTVQNLEAGFVNVDNISIYSEKDGIRSQLSEDSYVLDMSLPSSRNAWVEIVLDGDAILDNVCYIGGLKVSEAYQNYALSIFKGDFDSVEEAREEAVKDPSIDVTSDLVLEDMAQTGAGYLISIGNDEEYTMVFSLDGKDYTQSFEIRVYTSSRNILKDTVSLYKGTSNGRTKLEPYSDSVSNGTDTSTIKVTLNSNSIIQSTCYIGGLQLEDAYASYTVHIYKGDFSSAADAQNAVQVDPSIDVTNALLFDDMALQNAGYKGSIGSEELFSMILVNDSKEYIQKLILDISTLGNTQGVFDISDLSVYTENDSSRSLLSVKYPDDSFNGRNEIDSTEIYFELDGSTVNNQKCYVGGLKIHENYAGFDSVKIYKGEFDSAEAARIATEADSAIDVTNDFLSDNMTLNGSGFLFDTQVGTQMFLVVLTYGEEVYIQKFKLNTYLEYGHIEARLFGAESDYTDIADEILWLYSDEPVTEKFTLIEGYSPEDVQYLRLFYVTSGGMEDNTPVDKAVEGHFDSMEAASAEQDIKEQLFPERYFDKGVGYPAVYGGEGKKFTVFAEGKVFQFTIRAENEPVSEEPATELPLAPPNPGSADTYFRITGAKELREDQIYVLPYQHDTYYDVGFQTVFYILDDEQKRDNNLQNNKLIPTFTFDDAKIYAGHKTSAGTPQESGKGEPLDFSDGPVKYSAAATDKNHQKNYWVTFVPRYEGGAKLFVNGINGDDGAKREVFLTRIHDELHDIFIANVGDQPLTGLKVELVNPQNIKLDDYWKVGGENNNTLDPFESTEEGPNGELPNVAKIRLLPDGEGEISGTLKISANGQETVEIELTGNAGDPRLTTEDIPDAVRFVPYSIQLLHNNKYDWNTVKMELIEGSLPLGIELLENGEIYGVPKVTGDYKFTISMTNSDDRFRDREETFTLKVLPNTNENVDNASDDGYTVNQRVGIRIGNEDVVTAIKDQVFISSGNFNEFQRFYLNGEELKPGTEYKKEEGSTKITILSQTFQDKAYKNGEKNTIAAEFRVDNDVNNELKRTAQNFVLDLNGNNSSTGNNNNNHNNNHNHTNNNNNNNNSNSNNNNSSNNNNGNTTNGGNTPPVNTEILKQPVITAPVTIVETIDIFVDTNGDQPFADLDVERGQAVLQSALNKAALTPADEPILIEVNVLGLDTSKDNIPISIPEALVNALAARNNISLKINADHLSNITLSNTSLKAIAAAETGDLVIYLHRQGNNVLVNIYKGLELLTKIDGGIKVSFGGLNPGEVIVLIQVDGQERLVKKSVVTNGNVFALIDGSGTVKVIYNSKNFTDVSTSNWFYNAVIFVNSRELFVGINDTQFAPRMPMNRAMLAAVLYRLENSPQNSAANTFSDVLPNKWYTDPILWAQSENLISGYKDGRFGVKDNLSREQLAAILYRYANHIGINTIERADVSGFADITQTSAWASDAVRWAVAVGILTGDGTNLNPRGEATRAEVASIVMRFVENIAK